MDLERTALELRQVARRIYQAIATGNIGHLERHMTGRYGRLLLGAQRPRAWGAEYADFLSACRTELCRLGGTLPLIASRVEAHVEGRLGWIRDTPTLLSLSGEPVSLRLAALLRWEGDDWKLVELRLSAAEVPRAAA